MNTVSESISRILNYIQTIGQNIGVADAFDILIVAFIIYQFIRLTRRTNAIRVTRGIVMLLLILWLSGILRLTILNYLLRRAVELGLIALLIIFQPELRRALEKVGSRRLTRSLFSSEFSSLHTEAVITQTVLACADMSRSRTGALVVFARDNQLNEPISTGTVLDAEVTAELLKNIFFVKAPLHDGAAIVKDGRIAAAGCMLPLSSNTNLSRELGMRHRAGIGMSEQSDAVVVIVSEETGAVSVAIDGMLKRHLSPETVEAILRRELLPQEDETRRSWNFLRMLRGEKHE
jgi:diadenylate cyclase